MKDMKFMDLHNRSRIADEFYFNSMKDIFHFVPYHDQFEGEGGCSEDSLTVVAIHNKNVEQLLSANEKIQWASDHIRDWHNKAKSIGIQLAGKDPVGLIFTRRKYNQNEDEKYSEYISVLPPDWRKIRRRIEDKLRKIEDRRVIFEIAQILDVKYY